MITMRRPPAGWGSAAAPTPAYGLTGSECGRPTSEWRRIAPRLGHYRYAGRIVVAHHGVDTPMPARDPTPIHPFTEPFLTSRRCGGGSAGLCPVDVSSKLGLCTRPRCLLVISGRVIAQLRDPSPPWKGVPKSDQIDVEYCCSRWLQAARRILVVPGIAGVGCQRGCSIPRGRVSRPTQACLTPLCSR